MSWVAEAKAMAMARAPITQTASGCSETPASQKPRATSASWLMRIHPRFLPRKGGGKRSIEGDQMSLKLQGAWARVKSPMTLMSTPARAIHAGIAIQTRPRGRPEEKESRTTESRRQLPLAARRLAHVPGRRVATPPPFLASSNAGEDTRAASLYSSLIQETLHRTRPPLQDARPQRRTSARL